MESFSGFEFYGLKSSGVSCKGHFARGTKFW